MEFWDWMSRYYMASIGDVMNTALISAFKLESNTTILRTDKAYDLHELTDYEYLILEALDIKINFLSSTSKAFFNEKQSYQLLKTY